VPDDVQQDLGVGGILVVSVSEPIARQDVHLHSADADRAVVQPQLGVAKVGAAATGPAPRPIDGDLLTVGRHEGLTKQLLSLPEEVELVFGGVVAAGSWLIWLFMFSDPRDLITEIAIKGGLSVDV
jgi:hypothetical protein